MCFCFVSKRHFSSVFAARLAFPSGNAQTLPEARRDWEAGGPPPPITSPQTGRSGCRAPEGGAGSRAGAGRWCFSFLFNIYLIDQLPTAGCESGGGVGLLRRLTLYSTVICVLGSHVSASYRAVFCLFVSLLALLGRLVSVCFLYRCFFTRG